VDRAASVCWFCDTDFVGTDGPGGGKFATPEALAAAIAARWPVTTLPNARPYVVCTGGEPLLQLDAALIAALHGRGFEVAVETNGTQLAPPGLDWICVSPKANAPLRLSQGDELKLVYPQPEPEVQPERFVDLGFQHFFLQPLDGPEREAHTQAAVAYCLAHPQWRLSLQTHKWLGIP
jgi:7-carboxy-7-deazaguanine synthase (Cx14CxxC type)